MAIPKTTTGDKSKAPEAAKAKKKVTMVVAPRCTCTNPYTGEVFMKGVPRDTPKEKDSWYESQLEGGDKAYLKEVKM